MQWFVAYAAAGAVVGYLAGLLGIGGGMTIVPVLAALFALQSLSAEYNVHLALATAMGFAFFTSIVSAREHHKHAAVDWAIARRMAPGMVVGSLAATLATGWISQRALALTFAAIVYAAAVQMWLGRKPSAERGLPGPAPLFAIGATIGVISGLVSAGGTFLAMPVLLYCGVPMHRAIGTGAAMVVPVTLVGTIGYVIAGSAVAGLPAHTLGFVLWPALLALVAGSLITAPMGARAAHRLPVATLKRIFAVLLFALATKMLVTYW